MPSRTCASRRSASAKSASRRSVQASDTASSTRGNDGMPGRSLGGKYVPVKNGLPPWSATAVSGQPPWPRIACRAAMYTASTSGCSSRSTFTGTNPSFSWRAIASSRNDSRCITWHQWQLA